MEAVHGRLHQFRMRVTHGPDAGREAVSDGPELSVGTAPTNQLVLSDPTVSRNHLAVLSDPRAAIREALLSLLSSLERKRYARPDRVKTNRELAAELPARGAPTELVTAVAPLFAWFDRSFYSLEAIAPEDARRFLDDVSRLTVES